MYKALAIFREADNLTVRQIIGFTKEAQGKAFVVDKSILYISTEEMVERLSLREMVDLHNIYADKSVKGFKDKTAGADRLWKVLEVGATPSVYDRVDDVEKSRIERIPRKKKEDRLYVYTKIDRFDEILSRMPQQAQDLAHIVTADIKSKWSEPDLKEVVREAKENGTLKTKQNSWRIFQYYRSHLLAAGVLRLTTRTLKDL
jgi:hypothetical protein